MLVPEAAALESRGTAMARGSEDDRGNNDGTVAMVTANVR